MGYFPNGTAGDLYEAEYCERCIHYGEPETESCPVYFLHLLWNYDVDEEVKQEALELFIPTLCDVPWNEQCKMFYEKLQ